MATSYESASAQGVVDPVCDMTIDPADAVGHSEYKGQTYSFCSVSCLERFRATPAQFLEPDGETSSTAAGAVVKTDYTCPMDPEIRQKGPGACPKCGMALEPVMVAPATKTEWTCPMHPEIVRDEPGPCPICGMALEPRVVTLEDYETVGSRMPAGPLTSRCGSRPRRVTYARIATTTAVSTSRATPIIEGVRPTASPSAADPSW